MSIPWEQLNPALLRLFEQLARPNQLDGTGVDAEHANRSRRLIKPQIGYDLTLLVTTVAGLDVQVVQAFDAGTQTQSETVLAHRRITCRLSVTSIKNTDADWAWAPIERIRTRLRMTRSTEALLALNASLVRCSPSVLADFTKDNKAVSKATMDVILLVRVAESDPEPGDWIGSVSITSDKIKDADGNALPDALQMNGVVVDGAVEP